MTLKFNRSVGDDRNLIVGYFFRVGFDIPLPWDKGS